MQLRHALPVAAGLLLASLPAQKPHDLGKILSAVRSEHDVPALGAVVIHHGKIVAIGVNGVRKRGAKPKVTTKDLWHLGSCTKAMTATLLGTLVEKGKLSWDTTLAKAFPRLKIDETIGGATVRHLLSHRSGLMAHPDVNGLWSRLYAHKGPAKAARAMMAREILAVKPKWSPGDHYLYSNAGYMVAGALAEVRIKKSWESMLQKRVFKPLGIKSAGYGPPGRKGKVIQPLGHSATGTPIEVGLRADNPAALGPAGTVHMTLTDWAKFIGLHVRGARGDRGLLLKTNTFTELHKPFGKNDSQYALGWIVVKRPGTKGSILTHSGSNTMWYCVVWADPKNDFAVMVTCNQGGKTATTACDVARNRLLQWLKEHGEK